ncbi:LexA family transcriptional regulator [Acetivibrio sp. MSJd-27]|uniref:LexA family protein n=1 Tax=Acetivibrio sp. MSJd-27 TaxID=2841523 RepID=UPI0015A9BF4E|nr:LexA family transcriptional regulator [Acetivibrio sp. MSJd-27]MBU5449197.1 LexA family transcriptional regulator [Acetivibrio sp. MSJd-27]
MDLKTRRQELNMTLEEVGNIVGVGKSTVRKWETGDIANMKIDKVTLLAKALKTTPTAILGTEEKTEENPSAPVRIPVLGRVAAGIPIEAVEDILDYEEISADMASKGDYFALQIQGNSMEPRICQNDVVIVRCQPSVESGEIAVVLVNGENATCKKIIKQPNGISLVSLNPAYPPMFYTNEEITSLPVTILGKMVELRGKF